MAAEAKSSSVSNAARTDEASCNVCRTMPVTTNHTLSSSANEKRKSQNTPEISSKNFKISSIGYENKRGYFKSPKCTANKNKFINDDIIFISSDSDSEILASPFNQSEYRKIAKAKYQQGTARDEKERNRGLSAKALFRTACAENSKSGKMNNPNTQYNSSTAAEVSRAP